LPLRSLRASGPPVLSQAMPPSRSGAGIVLRTGGGWSPPFRSLLSSLPDSLPLSSAAWLGPPISISRRKSSPHAATRAITIGHGVVRQPAGTGAGEGGAGVGEPGMGTPAETGSVIADSSVVAVPASC